MIRAQARVLRDTAAELGKNHQPHVAGPADAFQILHKGGHCIGGVREQPLVQVVLENMGIKRVVPI